MEAELLSRHFSCLCFMVTPGFGVFGQDTTLDQQLKTAPDLSLEPWGSCCFASSGNKWVLCPGPIPPPHWPQLILSQRSLMMCAAVIHVLGLRRVKVLGHPPVRDRALLEWGC